MHLFDYCKYESFSDSAPQILGSTGLHATCKSLLDKHILMSTKYISVQLKYDFTK